MYSLRTKVLPVPIHLKHLTIVDSSLSCETVAVGTVRCTCGNESFHLLYPGQTKEYQGRTIPCTLEIDGDCFFIIKAKCCQCGKEHLLFDKDFHGWDAVLCHDPKQSSLPRPNLIIWKCQNCDKSAHSIVFEISGLSKADFIREVGDKFDGENWANAFEWINISLRCKGCGLESKNWVDYETA